MKRGYSDEQIIGILKENEAGVTARELCRKHGMSDATFYKWKAQFFGMEVNEARRLRDLEDENRRLKKLVADRRAERTDGRTSLSLTEIALKVWKTSMACGAYGTK